MAFALATAVAGAGTVSCAGTTTVTGSGTNFGAFAGTARLGGTITVGGVTKTITAIASTTSLTTDTAFGVFTAQAYTGQKEVVQTAADTMGTSLGAITGFTVTNRGDQLRTFDANGLDLTINGVLTVDSTTGQLRNNTTTSGLKILSTASASAELIINGRRAAANNGPFPYAGLDWLGVNGQQVMQLQGTATYPAKLTLRDSCIRYGADWFTTLSGQFSTITTEGETCWILNASGSGTNQARLRLNNTTPSINFTAKKTYVGVWLNFGVPQTSLKGYTPIATDGPEINLSAVAVASRIVIEDYDTTYIQAAYYAGAQIVLYGSAWARLKNNLLGTNIVWRSVAAVSGRFNVLEFSKQITIRAQDSAGNLLSNGYMYYQPVGANVAGIRAKGITSDITFDLTQQAVATVSGAATSEFVYAWDWANSSANESTYAYFCTGTTKGAETHVIRSSRYGYDKQSATVSLIGNGAATPTFVHVSLPTTDKVIANAAAITGVAFNFSTKTITVTGTLTIQQIYDAYQYQLNQTANLQQPDECTVASGQTYYVGWTINNPGTISAGANLTTIRAETITNTGTITAIYTSSAGTSSTLQLVGVTNNGVAAVWHPGTLATELFQTNISGSAATYTVYYPPGSAGLVKNYARELYPYQRVAGSITLVAGLNTISFVDIPDVGITEQVQATAAAYATLEGPSKFYDRTAIFRLTEQGIKLGQIVTRSGTALEIGTFSHVINTAAASVYAIVGSVITTKSSTYAPDSKYLTEIATPPATITAATTEVITIAREDANGDSQITIQAAGVSTFEIWKITDATNPDNYATGTLVATVGIGTWRFLSAPGFKFVIRDQTTNYRVVVEAEKGIYTAELFFGAAVQLAQAAEVSQINTKVDILQNDMTAVKGGAFNGATDSLAAISAAVNTIPASVWAYVLETGHSALALMRLMASVILGKVSGAGTTTETFRDVNDTKDRVVATVDEAGNRTDITRDAS
jgi:hypothetical protein